MANPATEMKKELSEMDAQMKADNADKHSGQAVLETIEFLKGKEGAIHHHTTSQAAGVNPNEDYHKVLGEAHNVADQMSKKSPEEVHAELNKLHDLDEKVEETVKRTDSSDTLKTVDWLKSHKAEDAPIAEQP